MSRLGIRWKTAGNDKGAYVSHEDLSVLTKIFDIFTSYAYII